MQAPIKHNIKRHEKLTQTLRGAIELRDKGRWTKIWIGMRVVRIEGES